MPPRPFSSVLYHTVQVRACAARSWLDCTRVSTLERGPGARSQFAGSQSGRAAAALQSQACMHSLLLQIRAATGPLSATAEGYAVQRFMSQTRLAANYVACLALPLAKRYAACCRLFATQSCGPATQTMRMCVCASPVHHCLWPTEPTYIHVQLAARCDYFLDAARCNTTDRAGVCCWPQ